MSDTTPADLESWVAELADAVGVPASDVPIADVLDLARDVAHATARAAAPVSAFVVGLAVGRGLESDEAWRRVAQLLAQRSS